MTALIAGPPLQVLVADARHSASTIALLRTAASPEPVIRAATTLRQTIAEVERHPPDLVLLDLSLGATRFEALDSLRAQSTSVPIVVIVSNDEELGEECLAHGATEYVLRQEITARLIRRKLRRAAELRAERAWRSEVEALRASHEQLMTVFDHLPVALFI